MHEVVVRLAPSAARRAVVAACVELVTVGRLSNMGVRTATAVLIMLRYLLRHVPLCLPSYMLFLV